VADGADVEGSCDAGCDAGDCAITTPETAKTAAMIIPDQVCVFMCPPVLSGLQPASHVALQSRTRHRNANFAEMFRCFYEIDRERLRSRTVVGLSMQNELGRRAQ
jgi:hypothetical protein